MLAYLDPRRGQLRDTNQDNRKQKEPQLGVDEGLENLLGTELAALDTSLVDTDVLKKSNLFRVGQPLRLHGGVWEEEDYGDTNGDGNTAEDNEHGAPASQTTAGSDMLEAIGHGATEDLTEAETHVPEGEAGSLLGLGVPLAANEHERGTNGGLEDAEKDAGDEEGAVIGGSGAAGRGNTPEGDVNTEPLAGGHHLEKVDVGNLEAEQADEEKRRDV